MKQVRMIVLACAAVLALVSVNPPRAAELSRAPDLTLSDIKGAKVRIDYRSGKLTLVNFWAIWCGPCREEMPQIAKMVESYGKRGFQAVGIAVQSGEAADVQSFLDENKEFGINYPMLLGDGNALSRFGDVQAVPTTFLVDPGGKIIRKFIGVTPGFPLKLEDEIKKALAPPPEAPPKP
jgi:cytochrome c biogenesis protein CcmG, thiol:disulfide interchange protein DsbE